MSNPVIRPTPVKRKSNEALTELCILCNKSCLERHTGYDPESWKKLESTSLEWKGIICIQTFCI